MASPFSKEEKQMLLVFPLSNKDLEFRKKKFEQIIKLYSSWVKMKLMMVDLAIKHYNN